MITELQKEDNSYFNNLSKLVRIKSDYLDRTEHLTETSSLALRDTLVN